ncbi:TadE/TadG family type IV pilus assembly protein [Chromohalobacter canadensis]|uniref:TadE/TadG family type IV pilus assembly protein n=1 Tax=Chromohalobacter canadensis TaxID=141389 RepID=UPI0021C1E2CC|nr:TadE family protein [Chromohalobacter canadensis]MCT8470191.1 pilus assembly protein [Chromohalobacter canadensis]
MSKANRFKYTPCSRQKGVAAIEFAIIFPVFFLVLYALIGYAFVFLIQSGLQNLASETARQVATISTIQVEEDNDEREALLESRVTSLLEDSWLSRFDVGLLESGQCPSAPSPTSTRVVVCMGAVYPLPTLNLFGLRVPGTPEVLTTHASIFLD